MTTTIDSSDVAEDDSPDALLLQLRHVLVDRVWLGFVGVAVLGTPLSVARAMTTGWMHLYTVHVLLAMSVIVVYGLRKRLPLGVKSASLMVILWAVGVGGLFTFGMLGTGYWWLVVSSLLASTLYSVRAGVVTAAVVVVLLGIAAFAFTSGMLTVPVDANEYIVTKVTWGSLVFATVLTPFIVFEAISAYQRTAIEWLHRSHAQRIEIERLATHDQLTGLPSLTLASDRLQMALNAAPRAGKKVAVLFVDLDGFKAVNDAYGHQVGDEVLKEIAKRLLKSIRAEDTAARIGGDEFILVLTGLVDGQLASVVASRAIAAIARPIDCGGHSIAVGVSIGIALFPDHAQDAASLRRIADAAMYTVKRTGKNNYAFGAAAAPSSPAADR